MNPQIETKIQRIQKISNVLRGACTGFLFLSAFLHLSAAVSAFVGKSVMLSYSTQPIPVGSLTLGSRILVGTIALLTGAVAVMIFHHLCGLFENYHHREIFTPGSARHIRLAGIGCVLWGAMKIVWAFLPVLVLDHAAQPVGVSGDTILIGAAIVVVSWLAEMAAALREENELTV